MGPGPSNVHPRVLQAMARPTIGHLDPAFVGLMDEICVLLRRAFRTDNPLTFPVSGPGSVGMETCFVNLLEPGDTIVVCDNGVFGGRMRQMASRCGATVVTVSSPWGRAVDVDAVAAALDAHPRTKVLAFVHAETSTGARSDARRLAALAQARNVLTLCDTVTSLGGIALEVDAWGLDAVYSGTQKCLSAPPGLSPVTFSPRAVECIRTRKTEVQSWFMDLRLVMSYWQGGAKRAYHHTAPVNALYGLHEALLMLFEEGLDASWQRHEAAHRRLAEGLAQQGMELLVPEGERLPQLNSVKIPAGVDDAAVRAALLRDHDLEIGAGLGDLAGRVWRIGLMGQCADDAHVNKCLDGLTAVLSEGVVA